MAVCPYCKKKVNSDNIKIEEISKKPFQFQRVMYSCPHCDAVLGFASLG